MQVEVPSYFPMNPNQYFYHVTLIYTMKMTLKTPQNKLFLEWEKDDQRALNDINASSVLLHGRVTIHYNDVVQILDAYEKVVRNFLPLSNDSWS